MKTIATLRIDAGRHWWQVAIEESGGIITLRELGRLGAGDQPPVTATERLVLKDSIDITVDGDVFESERQLALEVVRT